MLSQKALSYGNRSKQPVYISYSATVVPPQGSLHFYSASKHAVRALTEGLRHELGDCSSAIRVSSVSPGLVKTDIYTAALGPEFSEQVFADKPHLLPQDIASLVSYLLSAPPHVQVHDIIVKPLGEKI
ncbi:dehydrogenase/reductase SDR family member 11-like [Schistocerca nitens]|uniref:dehydrogenase/reductase SDR family member 11-like n=1 Tax=Schistocerca nitens TaxID=7011 RepID=UPI0021199CEE|nr:dehydrogenase/reductase SDR family member 11-like [Schistocerca nitens]